MELYFGVTPLYSFYMNTTLANYKNDPRFKILEDLYQDADRETLLRDIFFTALQRNSAIQFADFFVNSTGDITELVLAWKLFKRCELPKGF